ncbi:MAG: TerB family tellurite resistance protein [Polyangiaceae bacterium]
MIWLSNSTVSRLRDQLRLRGQRASVPVSVVTGESDATDAEFGAMVARYGAMCETMFLMMSADGNISTEERDVVAGALRTLSEDSIRSAHIEAMLDRAIHALADEGRDARLKGVVAELVRDPARAEVAFVLAAAVAFADGAIADEENDTLSLLADGLGIGETRVNELLDGVEADRLR